MFWDSRARGLEAQALAPIESLEEMRGAARTGRECRGGVPSCAWGASRNTRPCSRGHSAAQAPSRRESARRAIAAFERSLITTDAPFDRYMRGDHAGLERDASPRHGGLRQSRMHPVPQRPDVLGLQVSRAWRVRQSGAWRRRSRCGTAVRVPHADPSQSRLHRAVHAQRSAPGCAHGHRLLPDHQFGERLRAFRRGQRPSMAASSSGSPVGREALDPLIRQLTVIQRIDDVAAFLDSLNGTFDRTIPSRVPSGLRPGGR